VKPHPEIVEEKLMKTAKALVSEQGWSFLQRPRFTPGLLLEDEDLTAGVDYTRNLMRLMFRSLFGCGLICGLKIEAALICKGRKLAVTVGSGLALDGAGNPIQVPGPVRLEFDPACDDWPAEIWVSVCYREKSCRPRDVSCSPDDDSRIETTRSRDGFEIRLQAQVPACACACGLPAPPGTGQPGSGCCQDENTGAKDRGTGVAEAATAVHPAGCACYQKHNDGECEPDCSCGCVFIGSFKISLEQRRKAQGQEVPVDLEVEIGSVRKIRPLLTGFLPCLQRAGDQTPTPTSAPAPAPAPVPTQASAPAPAEKARGKEKTPA
jgi:hypothetical protein